MRSETGPVPRPSARRHEQEAEMSTLASRRSAIRAAAAQTLEHCPYHPDRRIDFRTGATSLTQALIVAAGGTFGAGHDWASEPAEPEARASLHAEARELLAELGLTPPTGISPCRVLARWERRTADPAAVYRLVGAHTASSHHFRLPAAA
jgi:hypothetical protein